MANFKQAYDLTLKYEGGYVPIEDAKKIGDTGGETYAGIARNYNPQWSGWSDIDAIKKSKKIKLDEKIPSLKKKVEDFYEIAIWDKNKLGQINNQQFANNLYDFIVNSGTGSSTKWGAVNQLQKILNIGVDGVIGNQTISTINNHPNISDLNNKLAEARASVIRRSNKIKDSIKPQLMKRATDFLQDVTKVVSENKTTFSIGAFFFVAIAIFVVYKIAKK